MSDTDTLHLVKPIVTVSGLALLLTLESLTPAIIYPRRWSHVLRNLSLAFMNALLLALPFGVAIAFVVQWTTETRFGLLHLWELPFGFRLLVGLLMLDFWLYLWHRANHLIPLLWRFHQVHHCDEQVDVTTATRFHPGELILSAVARLLLIPLLGMSLTELLVYDTLLVVATQFHHANLSLGRADRLLRWLIVTPGLHATHHSLRREECDSNFGVVLSVWDRLLGSLRPCSQTPGTFGVTGIEAPTLPTILCLPFSLRTAPRAPAPPPAPEA